MRTPRSRSGIISILALFFLVMFAGLAALVTSSGVLNLQKSDNVVSVQSARFQAESGLSYLIYVVKKMEVAGGVQGQALLDAVAAHLSAELDGTGSLGGSACVYDSSSIVIPTISLAADRQFDALVSLPSDNTVRLRVTGHSGSVSRTVGVDFVVDSSGGGVFDYGIASGGPIRLTGNDKILGANDPSEANVLSATYDVEEAVNMTGNSRVEGNLSLSNAAGHASLTGNVKIGSYQCTGNETVDLAAVQENPLIYGDSFNIGVGEVEFPEADPSVFEPFAVNIVDSSTNTSGNRTFENIRIKANSNNTFSGNINLYGVIYVETPNALHFTGNVRVTGVIVTQDAGDVISDANSLKFTGNLTVRDLDELPDRPEFDWLRGNPGTFLLAPGFTAQFSGNFGTIAGCMAAECFKWTGNAGGTVRGGIISYSGEEFRMTGNATLTVDRSGVPDIPPGFTVHNELVVNPDTYVEY